MSAADKSQGSAVGLIRPVTDFYARVLRSPRVAHHFEGAAMEALIAEQAGFITAAHSGETRYTPADLARVHARLLITDDEFNELISILRSTCDDHHIREDQQETIVSTFEEFREPIVHDSIVRS